MMARRLRRDGFQALAQHLAPLAERRARDRLKGADPAGKGRFAGRQVDDARGDLRRRHEGRGRHVEEDARFASASRRARRGGRNPSGRISSATIRSATSRWNISVSERHQGGQSRRGEPAGQKGRADVVGQVGDDPHRIAADQRKRIEGQRIGFDHLQPARIMRGDLGKGRQAAGIALDGDDLAGAGREDRAGQPAGSRPDLDDRRVLERVRPSGRCGW